MRLFADAMTTDVTVGKSTTDEDMNQTVTSTRTIQARVELASEKVRDSSGNVLRRADVIYTHDHVEDDEMFWYDGATAPNIDEAQKPSAVMPSDSLDGTDTLYKVEF